MSTGIAEVAIGDGDWDNAENPAYVADGLEAAQQHADTHTSAVIGNVALTLVSVDYLPGVRLGTMPRQQRRQIMGGLALQTQVPRFESAGPDGTVYSLS